MSAHHSTTGRALAIQSRPTRRTGQREPKYYVPLDVEREIGTLEDVTGVRVLGTPHEIEEIHILARHSRPAKKIVRDIESLLLVRFGIRIDHRRISIVQTTDKRVLYPAPVRPRIQEVKREGDAVQVLLQVGGQVITGQSVLAQEQPELPGASQALLDAVEQMLEVPGTLVLEGVQLCEMLGERIVLVLVRWLFAGQQELLVGACLVRDNPLEAAAKAAIDAMNRRLAQLQQAEALRAKRVPNMVAE